MIRTIPRIDASITDKYDVVFVPVSATPVSATTFKEGYVLGFGVEDAYPGCSEFFITRIKEIQDGEEKQWHIVPPAMQYNGLAVFNAFLWRESSVVESCIRINAWLGVYPHKNVAVAGHEGEPFLPAAMERYLPQHAKLIVVASDDW